MDVTYNFTAGTRAVAEQVNTNFADVKSAVDPLETAVADIETQLTSGIILPDGSVDFTRLQSYKTYTVSNATNATPIVVTAVAHSFLTGDKVFISGVGGNTAANGTFVVTKIGDDTFSLNSSVGNGTFTTNGTVVIVPVNNGNLVNKAYLDNNAGALKTVDLGTITTGKTLATNTVSLANVTATLAITLPTILVAGNENTVVFDFTTTSSSQPTISTSGTLKWSDKNRGLAPSAYSTISGVRNVLTFKTHDGGSTWEAEYTTFGGVETNFVQPVLSANGTLGGGSFAVSNGVSLYSGQSAYNLMDGNNSSQCHSVYGSSIFDYTWYNPNPLKLSNITLTESDTTGILPADYSIFGSNDGVNWVTINSGTNTNKTTCSMNIVTTSFYKYWKMHSAQNTGNTSGYCGGAECSLTGIYIAQ